MPPHLDTRSPTPTARRRTRLPLPTAGRVLVLTLSLTACGQVSPTTTTTPSLDGDAPQTPPAVTALNIVTGTNDLTALPFVSVTNGLGPVERNTSNGGAAAGDGRTMTMNGQTYARGYGVHADSTMVFDLAGRCETFSASLGVDDEVGSAGRVIFQIFTDGKRVYDSGVMTGASTTKNINVRVRGARQLQLKVLNAGDPTADHANWANPVLKTCTAPTVAPAPAPAPEPAPTPTPTPTPGSAPTGYTNVRDFGARCDGVTDDTAAIQKALSTAANVYIPTGTCLVGDLELRSNQNVIGDGPTSVLQQKATSMYLLSANPGRKGTPNVADNLRNIRVEKLKLKGQAGRVEFSEHVHLLNLNAVSDVVVNEVTFEGYVGDGLYLGSSNTQNTERHNERVKILNSVFDGLVKNNRNGISIIDGTDIEIRGTRFLRTGRAGMPGAIDLEPDGTNDAFSRIRNITIDDCEFRDIGADAVIALLLRPQDLLTTPSQNITISNVRAYGDNRTGLTGLVLSHSSWGATQIPTATTPPLNVRVVNSSFDGIYRPFLITQMKGAVIEQTTFRNSRAFAYIGTGDGVGFSRDVALRGVTFDNVGYDTAVGSKSLTLYSNENITLSGVTVQRGTGLGIAFSSGQSRHITISDTKIVNDSGKLAYGIRRFADHTLTPSTNTANNIQLVNVGGNDFPGS